MAEKYEIKIVMEAVSRVAPAMRSVSREADKMSAHFKAADDSIKKLDRHMVQFDGQLVKAKNTLRGMNPTLTATANKFGTLSETLTSTNRHMKSLDNNAAKASGALGALAGVITGLQKKLDKLDAQMELMGAKTYKPELDVHTTAGEAKIKKFKKELEAEAQKVYTSKWEFRTKEAKERVKELTAFLKKEGFGKDADEIVGEIRVHFEDKNRAEREAAIAKIKKREEKEIAVKLKQDNKLSLSNLRAELKELDKEEVGITAVIKKGKFDAQRSEIYASILALAGVDVEPEVHLDVKAFEAKYLLVEAQLAALGLKREHVKVMVDMDTSGAERAMGLLEGFANHEALKFDGLTRKIRDNLLGLGIIFAEPLLSALTGLVGGLTAVALSASQAALALAGLASAGIAQALPMAGILAASLARVVGVIKAVSAAQAEKDKGADQGGAKDLQAAGRADALRNAHEGLTNALRSQALAQEALNDARLAGIRTLTDMRLAQERANMAADESARTYAAAQGQGTGQSAQSLELQARSDRISANRQNVDTNRAVAGGIEGLPAVQAAKRSLDDATRSVAAARRAIKQAEASFNQAASSQGAAASALAIALGKLTDSEKKLYNSITRFRALFQKGGPLNAVTDPMIAAFADGLDKLAAMLKDPAVLGALTGLAEAMGKSFSGFAKFMTTGPMRQAFIFFAEQGQKNVGKLTHVLEGLLRLFVNVAKAASTIFTQALEGTGSFLDQLVEKTGSKEGQDRLKKFFQGAYEQLVGILKLSGAILRFFAALAGAGGADEGARGVDNLTKSINNLTKRINENQEDVRKFFRDAIDISGQVLSVFLAIGEALIDVMDSEAVKAFADLLKDTVIPVLVFALKLLGLISKLISTAFNNGIVEGIGKFLALYVILGKTAGLVTRLGLLVAGLSTRLAKVAGFDLAKPFNLALDAVKKLLVKMGLLKAAQTGAGGLPANIDYLDIPDGKNGPGKKTGKTSRLGKLFKGPGKLLAGGAAGGGAAAAGTSAAGGLTAAGATAAAGVAAPVVIISGAYLLARYQEQQLQKNPNIFGTKAYFEKKKKEAGSLRSFRANLVEDRDRQVSERDAARAQRGSFRASGGKGGQGGIGGGQVQDINKSAGIKAADDVLGAKKISEAAIKATGFTKNLYQQAEKLAKLGDAGGIHRLFAGGEIEDWGKKVGIAGEELKKIKKTLKETEQSTIDSMGGVGAAIEDAKANFASYAKSGSTDLHSLRTATQQNMFNISKTLGKKSAEGKEALSANFRLAAEAVQASMDASGKTTKEGLAQIERYMRKSFSVLGMSDQQVTDYLRDSGKGSGKTGDSPGMGAATGGFIGNKGERGGDTVPVWVGRGEAVLNWAHQKMVEPAMRSYYGSGLGEMFKRVSGRHSGAGPTTSNGYAQGGYIQGAAGNPARGAANDLAQRMFKRGFNVTSARRNTNTYHGSGDALDFGDSANDLRKVWSVLSPQKSKFAELFGPAAFAGLWHYNTKFQDAGLQADHEDHVHVAVLNAVGKLGGAIAGTLNGLSKAPVIPKVKSSVKGALGAISQRTLDLVRKQSNKKVKQYFDANRGATTTGTEEMSVSPRGGGRSVGASVFGGPADPGTGHIGYRGDDLNVFPNSFAELNMGTALGNLPYKAKLRVTGPKGSKVLYKRDIGAGGGNVQGKTRAIDLWYKAAEALGISGLGLVKIEKLAKGGYAGGMPFVGSYARGGEIPRDGMAHVHKGEVVVPRAVAAAVKTPKLPSYKSVASRIKSATEALSTSSDFEDTNKAAKALIAALKKLSVKSKKGFEKLKKTVDTAAADGGVFDTLVGKIDKKSRARRARGLSERDTLFQERKGISATGEILDDELAQAKRILAAEEKKGRQKDKNGKRKGNKKGIANAKIAIENIRASQVDLREKFNQNVQDTVSNITETYDTLAKINDRNGVSDFAATDKLVSGLKGQLARVDKGSQFANPELAKSIRAQIADSIRGGTFNRVGTGAQLQQKKDDFLGKATTTLLDASIEATQSGIKGLRDRIANDGSDADNALREKIAELETDLVGLVADRLQKSIDAINKAAETELTKNDLTQSFAQLGITRDQAINGNFSIAGLGRTDYGTIGNALTQRGNILTNQRSGLAGQLTTAIEQGNTGAIEELTKQIEDLNLQVVDNIKAIRDNTDAAFDFTVGQKQEQNGFLLGLNQGAQAISSGLIAISGIADDATQLAILNQRQSQLTQTSKDDRGFLGALLGGFGINVGNLSSVSGNNLVPYLESLYNQGLSSGQMDDAQITAMKQLITAIIQSETALLDNTKAIKDMSSSVMQTFTSSAWTTFRQAIFDGNSGLLPQYSIPSMDTGGYVAKSGLFNLHAGEKVLRKDEVDNSHTIGEFHTHITSPTEVLDPYTIGPKIAWSLAGTGRN